MESKDELANDPNRIARFKRAISYLEKHCDPEVTKMIADAENVREYTNVWGSDEPQRIEANLTKEATVSIPNANVMSQSFPGGIEIKDGKPYLGDERWRMIVQPFMEDNMPAWREFLGTLRAVAKATGCMDEEEVISISWHYLPATMPVPGEMVSIPFHTVTDGIGGYSVMMEFVFEAIESLATPMNTVAMSLKLYLDRDGKDTLSIEHDASCLRWARFHLKPYCDTPLPADPEDMKRPESLEYDSNLGIVKP